MEILLPCFLSLGIIFLVVSRVIKLYKNWKAGVFKKQLHSNLKSYAESQVVSCPINVARTEGAVIEPEQQAPKAKEPTVPECITLIEEELRKSQKHLSDSSYMIPLCVATNDAEKVENLGAIYCTKTQVHFWPKAEDLTRRQLVVKWLPKIYRTDQKKPVIVPQMIPEPLWGINLRSLLPEKKWEALKKSTSSHSGRCCCICGCRNINQDWEVECDEQWSYKIDSISQVGIVYFQGLQAVCTACHNIYHFGRAYREGHGNTTRARIMVLNNCSSLEASCIIDNAYKACIQQSNIENWIFNFDALEETYGLKYFLSKEHCLAIKKYQLKNPFLELPKFTEYCSILNSQKGCSAINSSGFQG
jgi:hypothetical protein